MGGSNMGGSNKFIWHSWGGGEIFIITYIPNLETKIGNGQLRGCIFDCKAPKNVVNECLMLFVYILIC